MASASWHNDATTEFDAALGYEFGSGGDICSNAHVEEACPSQCCWCVEAQRCALHWQECAPDPRSGGSAFWLLAFVVLMALAGFACTRWPPDPNRGIAMHQDARVHRPYESYQTDTELDEMHAAPRAQQPMQPEGQHLLSGEP